MKVLIDADACPVTNIAIAMAVKREVEVLLVCDCAHYFQREGAQTITVLRGADSADYRLANLAQAGDVVVTQDYGLAAMCLARGTYAISQNGLVFTENNIDGLLEQRHQAAKLRRSGGRIRGPAKRTRTLDEAFEIAFGKLLEEAKPLK